MTVLERDQFLREATVLKMRAMRLRALGSIDEQWESVKLLHQAAKKELDALAASVSPSEPEQAGARIEACGLFLEASDPVRAAEQWGRFPLSVFTLSANTAVMAEMSPRYERQVAEFSQAWRALSGGAPGVPSVTSLSREQLHSLVEKYPGVAELWWALSVRTESSDEAKNARERMLALAPDMAQVTAAQSAWERIEDILVRNFSITLKAEQQGRMLPLELVNRIAAVFGEVLRGFAEGIFGSPVELLPTGSRIGSYIVNIAAQGLPPYALDELASGLLRADARIDARRLSELLTLLQQSRVKLTVFLAAPNGQSAQTARPTIVIDEELRNRLLDATEAASLRTLDSRDVPQADSLERVFRMVEKAAQRESFSPQDLEITQRQVYYYRRAAQILGLLTDSDEVTAAGRLIVRLGPEARLRATVVHFESSRCGDAWIQWSKGKTLLDVNPDSAYDFLRECVPGLSRITAGRRVKTLMAWHRILCEHHYSSGVDDSPVSA